MVGHGGGAGSTRLVIAGLFALALLALTVVPGGTLDPDAAAEPAAATPQPSTPEQTVPTVPSETSSSAPTPPTTDPSEPAPTDPSGTACTPSVPLVDPLATPEATCLAATLDQWQAEGRYGLGQQLNVSSESFLDPVTSLAPERPALVGFDLQELALGEGYGFADPPVDALLRLAADGVLLTASWHTDNPHTGQDSSDRRWQDLGALLDPSTRDHATFWADYDSKLELLRRLQDGDGGRFAPAAVLFRPLHEANGDWFWWAQGTDPSAYKQLYAAMQQRAWDAGVHNIVWGWSANAVNGDHISDPLTILPDRVDLVGIDSYESMVDRAQQDQQLNLGGLAELAARVPRAAVTEAGPHGSADGNWDPAVVAPSAEAVGVRPAYVMMWFDDGDAADGYTGLKQLGSLQQGPLLLSGCPSGVCG